MQVAEGARLCGATIIIGIDTKAKKFKIGEYLHYLIKIQMNLKLVSIHALFGSSRKLVLQCLLVKLVKFNFLYKHHVLHNL